jgi:hypothetical protein
MYSCRTRDGYAVLHHNAYPEPPPTPHRLHPEPNPIPPQELELLQESGARAGRYAKSDSHVLGALAVLVTVGSLAVACENRPLKNRPQ